MQPNRGVSQQLLQPSSMSWLGAQRPILMQFLFPFCVVCMCGLEVWVSVRLSSPSRWFCWNVSFSGQTQQELHNCPCFILTAVLPHKIRAFVDVSHESNIMSWGILNTAICGHANCKGLIVADWLLLCATQCKRFLSWASNTTRDQQHCTSLHYIHSVCTFSHSLGNTEWQWSLSYMHVTSISFSQGLCNIFIVCLLVWPQGNI